MPKPIQPSTYTFPDLIKGGFLYIDKTRHLYELIRGGKGIFFLARPRRFGKSLLISTLETIFHGHRHLFQGLWIATSDYEWPVHPVIRIDFGRMQVSSADELKAGIERYLRQIARQHAVTLGDGPYYALLEELILALAAEKQVVILIDEYDKPLTDNLTNLAEAEKIRDVLRGFYTLIKSMDAYLRFVFITGISRFSKVGLFSAMNNLTDITMTPRFATLLGLTEDEVRRDLQEQIAAFADETGMTEGEMLEKMRYWYNGFCFAADSPNVYNPFSTLQLFYNRRFANYWFDSGTPTFLIKLIKERQIDITSFAALEVPELVFSTYEIARLDLIPLLFQTGYLTIKESRQDPFGTIFTLSYPNREVENAFLSYLLSAYDETELAFSQSHLRRLYYALDKGDLSEFFAVLELFFANIDYDLQVNQEKYYQTIFYLIFLLLGVHVTAEVKTNRGRIDTVIEVGDRVFLFEFKLDGSAEEALAQIRQHAYYQKYRKPGKTVTLVGVSFDSAKRTISDWQSDIDQS